MEMIDEQLLCNDFPGFVELHTFPYIDSTPRYNIQ